MDRAERTGLGVAAVGHVVLFAALSASFLANPKDLAPPSMSVSLVPDVALEATAPPATEAPAASVAPEQGPPEDAAPPAAPIEAAPEPAPPVKTVAPAPLPKPAPVAKPQPKPLAAPAPAKQQAQAKPAPAAKTPPKPAAKPGAGTQVASANTRPRGAILGDNFLKGIVADRSQPEAKGQVAPAATMSAKAAADIASAIVRQVQPCADRQVIPGPGAEKIRVAIRLSINRDGSLAGRPQIVGHDGVDDSNARYVDRVDDLAIATFVGCAPLKGLPPELYAVPRGWKLFTLRYKLPG
jgi:outer membrane biosynthesis protein TonB